MTLGIPKKCHRAAANSTIAVIDSSVSNKSVAEVTQVRHRSSPIFFNDRSTADVILRLFVDSSLSTESSSSDSHSVNNFSSTSLYLHSDILRRSNYFSALLSDRWMGQGHSKLLDDSDNLIRLNLSVPSSTPGSIQSHLTVLELLYTSVFQIQSHIRQHIFPCKFSFRNTSDRNQCSRKGSYWRSTNYWRNTN